jgi:hypothetical protein
MSNMKDRVQNLNIISSVYPSSVRCLFIISSKGGGPQNRTRVSGPGAGICCWIISLVTKPTPYFQFKDSSGFTSTVK